MFHHPDYPYQEKHSQGGQQRQQQQQVVQEEKKDDEKSPSSSPTKIPPMSVFSKLHNNNNNNQHPNGTTRMTTTTIGSNGRQQQQQQNYYLTTSSSPTSTSSSSSASSSSSNPMTMRTGTTTNNNNVDTTSNKEGGSITFWSDIRLCCIELPLCILFTTLVCLYIGQDIYLGPITKLIDSRELKGGMTTNGYYKQLKPDVTYYNRQCTKDDISTTNANDLLLYNDTTTEDAVDRMMTHGAVMFQNVLSKETSSKLRDYLESRHHIQHKLPWHEKFFEEIGRLSLGLGAVHDDPIITQALTEVGKHPLIKRTIEGILGPDPAIAEISTLTTMSGSEDQGIHTDTDFFGSSVLYSRTFLHSYTMFMALQDTPSRMGATTICAGTQHCANDDLEQVCLENGAFEVSSNGFTGKDVGVLYQGDAMMFDQNVWHRGPANQDPKNPNKNRVMFIMTFISRTKNTSPDDIRQQGLGTYYYQRWNHWGHTYNDLLNVKGIMYQPLAALRALGIYKPTSANWGITWFEHFAQQIGNREHFYADYELPEFIQYLQTRVLWLPKSLYNTINTQQWETFIIQFLNNCITFIQTIYITLLCTYVTIQFILLFLSSIYNCIHNIYTKFFTTTTSSSSSSNDNEDDNNDDYETYMSKKESKLRKLVRLLRPPQFLFRILFMHSIILFIAALSKQYINETDFIQSIWSGEFNRRPFPTTTTTSSTSSSLSFNTKTIELGSSTTITTIPEREDILIGTRYDADFLGSKNLQLDYHPGNQRFQQYIKQFSSSWFTTTKSFTNHNNNNILLNEACNGLLTSIKEYKFSNIGIGPIRFLYQDYKNGHWKIMNYNNNENNNKNNNDLYINVIRRSILMESNKLLYILNKHLKSKLASSRFGKYRDTYLERIITPSIIYKWQTIIFNESQKINILGATTTTKPKPNINNNNNNFVCRRRTNTNINTIQKHLKTTNILRNIQNELETDNNNNNNKEQEDEQEEQIIFKVGDRIRSRTYHHPTHHHHHRRSRQQPHNGKFVWEVGTIVHIVDNENALMVSSESGSLKEISINDNTRSMVEFYKPIKQGDFVQVEYTDKQSYQSDWHYSIIINASPFGTYSIQYLEDGSYEHGVPLNRIANIELPKDIHKKQPKEDKMKYYYRLIQYHHSHYEQISSKNKKRSIFLDETTITTSSSSSSSLSKPLPIGQRVRVNYQMEGEWFDGIIVNFMPINNSYVYDIQYDDGDYETRVERRAIYSI